MKRILSVLFAAGIFLVAFASPSSAQVFVLNSCGTVPPAMKTLVPGAPGMFFVDTTGTLCAYGSGGGGGGGLSVVDGASWTAGTSPFTPTGGVFNDSATVLSSGQQGSVRLNANREVHITCDLSNPLCTLLASPIPTGTNIIGKVGIDQTTPGTTNGVNVNNTVNAALSLVTIPHAQTTALANNLSAKASAGVMTAFNCTSITGGAAGYCIAYNGATTPSTGALTGANVLDFCFFDTTARGCSLSHLFPGAIAFSSGIQILVSSAASPYTYTTGTDTAAISADYQ